MSRSGKVSRTITRSFIFPERIKGDIASSYDGFKHVVLIFLSSSVCVVRVYEKLIYWMDYLVNMLLNITSLVLYRRQALPYIYIFCFSFVPFHRNRT